LIIALWVIMILTLLIGGFAFDMHIEAQISSFYRKRVKAQYLARAGLEYGKLLIARSAEGESASEDTWGDEEDKVGTEAVRFSRGMAANLTMELGDGEFALTITPGEEKRNINSLTDEDWEEILDQAGIPEDLWPELIDCFTDWVDDDGGLDAKQLNGAESDDPFYTERGYECKNGPLDTVDELLLIKGFTESIVYGGKAEDEDDEPYRGIASMLTVWSDGRVNINTASREVLMTLSGMDEFMVDDILECRKGEDGELGTRDDGCEDMSILPEDIRDKVTTSPAQYVQAVSIGKVGKVKSGIWAIMQIKDGELTPVFWREEDL
ncbi:MAG: hypothetical protein EOM20_18970, partial [Spartobacteria bacterium]|nr:hypothetical protein [Spartobacteria bacterium]